MGNDRRDAAADRKLQQLTGAWLETHRSTNTRAAYAADLAWFDAWCTEHGCSTLSVGQRDVERFCTDSHASGEGAAVTRRRLAALTSFFGHAVASGDMADNPAEDVKRPSSTAVNVPVEIDDLEARALLVAARDLGPRAGVLVALLLLEGLKLGEALAIDMDDLGANPSTVTVARRGRRQSLALHTTTAAAIEAYAEARADGPLLTGNDVSGTRRLTRSGAHQILKRVGAHAGLPKPISANTLRRYFASSAYHDGATVDDVRASLGHGDRRTTRRLLSQEP